jgi:hypothetical protein
MYLTVAHVEDAVRRLHNLRLDVMEKRAHSTDLKEIEWCHEITELLRTGEKEHLDILRCVKGGEKSHERNHRGYRKGHPEIAKAAPDDTPDARTRDRP